DQTHPQPVGIRVLLGRDHTRDGEGRERLCLVVELLDLKADHGELVGDLRGGRAGVEMLLQPGEGEFHVRFSRAVEGTTARLDSASSLPRLRGRDGERRELARTFKVTRSSLPPMSARRAR